MQKLSSASSRQMALGAFSNGSVVKLDGGTRLRLDDVVDFWPCKAGKLVPRPEPVRNDRRVTCRYCEKPAALFTGKGQDAPRPGATGEERQGASSMFAYLVAAREGRVPRPLGLGRPQLLGVLGLQCLGLVLRPGRQGEADGAAG